MHLAYVLWLGLLVPITLSNLTAAALIWVITKLQPACEACDEPHPLEFQQAKRTLEFLLTAAMLLIWMFARQEYLLFVGLNNGRSAPRSALEEAVVGLVMEQQADDDETRDDSTPGPSATAGSLSSAASSISFRSTSLPVQTRTRDRHLRNQIAPPLREVQSSHRESNVLPNLDGTRNNQHTIPETLTQGDRRAIMPGEASNSHLVKPSRRTTRSNVHSYQQTPRLLNMPSINDRTGSSLAVTAPRVALTRRPAGKTDLGGFQRPEQTISTSSRPMQPHVDDVSGDETIHPASTQSPEQPDDSSAAFHSPWTNLRRTLLAPLSRRPPSRAASSAVSDARLTTSFHSTPNLPPHLYHPHLATQTRRHYKDLLLREMLTWRTRFSPSILKKKIKYDDDDYTVYLPSNSDLIAEQKRCEYYARQTMMKEDNYSIHVFGTEETWELDRLRAWVACNQHKMVKTPFPPGYVERWSNLEVLSVPGSVFTIEEEEDGGESEAKAGWFSKLLGWG